MTQIIPAVNKRVRFTSRKYGIKIPRNKKEVEKLDRENGNTLWTDAINKEMANMGVPFKLLKEGEDPPKDMEYVGFHIVYDVKMDFTQKARLVADGHLTPDPAVSTYSGVVSHETVRIAFTYAALNDLDIKTAEINGAYLQTPIEGYYTRLTDEFGIEYAGKLAYVVRAAYGLKEAGACFRNHLQDCMCHLGYKLSNVDNELWLRKSEDDSGDPYYEYLLLYVDDCLAVSHRAEQNILEVGKYFRLKPDSLGPPKQYLGGKVSTIELPNGVKAYTFSSTQYVREVVKNVEVYMKLQGFVFTKKKIHIPLPTSYHPELDSTPELNEDEAAYYQSMTGILRWIVELGQIDIGYEASAISSHTALPRLGHLEKVFLIFGYLKHHSNARLIFDPSYPNIEYERFPENDWEQFYGKVSEELPHNILDPYGR